MSRVWDCVLQPPEAKSFTARAACAHVAIGSSCTGAISIPHFAPPCTPTLTLTCTSAPNWLWQGMTRVEHSAVGLTHGPSTRPRSTSSSSSSKAAARQERRLRARLYSDCMANVAMLSIIPYHPRYGTLPCDSPCAALSHHAPPPAAMRRRQAPPCTATCRHVPPRTAPCIAMRRHAPPCAAMRRHALSHAPNHGSPPSTTYRPAPAAM